uniref:Atg6 n=1 Tax=Arundo donax TaxID=35708 RepID=A0A0A9EBN8_ARUDO
MHSRQSGCSTSVCEVAISNALFNTVTLEKNPELFPGKGLVEFALGGDSCAPSPSEEDVLYMEEAGDGSIIYDPSIALVGWLGSICGATALGGRGGITGP